MGQISTQDIYLQVNKKNIGGFEQVPIPSKNEIPLRDNETPYKDAELSSEDLVVMEQFAKLNPQGKRELEINVKELTDSILSKDLQAVPLTITSGTNAGGLLSVIGGVPKKQSYYNNLIKNKNNLKSNPDPNGFKNNFFL